MYLHKFAGFCYGVKRAVDTVKKLKEENPSRNICVLGELIHNSHVIEELDAMGIKSLTELPQKGDGICVVRSHGESPEVFEAIEKAGFEVYDLTCPDVKKVQQKAIELANSIIIDISNIRDELRRKSSNIAEGAAETDKRHEDQLSNFTEREKELGSAVDDVIRELQQ